MFAIGQRRLKLTTAEIERLLLDHGLREVEVEGLTTSGKMTIRALREVAKGPEDDTMTQNVRAALISVGELKSKSIRRRIIRMFKTKRVESSGSGGIVGNGVNTRVEFDARPSLVREIEEMDDTADLEESEESDDSEDLNRMEAHLQGMEEDDNDEDDTNGVLAQNRIHSYSVALDGNRRAFEAPQTTGDSFWETLGVIFCAAPTLVEEPTYTVTDIEESKEPLEEKLRNHKKKIAKTRKKLPPRRQSAPAAISSSTSTSKNPQAATASKIGGHSLLLSTYRLAERDGKALPIDASNVDLVMETCIRDSLRVSRLYLCLDSLDGDHKFEWKLFSGKPGGLDLVYTSFPPGYGNASQVAIRSETYVNANWKRVFDIMMTDERTASYDPNVNTFKQLRIDHERRIYARHYWFHAVWPTKARDFVMVTTWERLEGGEDEEGAILISTIGLPDSVAPSSDECVRAYVCSSSCLIRPGYSPSRKGCRAPSIIPASSLPGKAGGAQDTGGSEEGAREKDDSWCHVTFCTHCDPGGGVPSFVTNMLGPSNSLQCLLAMRAIVEGEEKEEKEK